MYIYTYIVLFRTGNSKEESGHTTVIGISQDFLVWNCVFGTILYQICMILAKS